ncbi:MAG: polyprenyl diphosphate synthase [Betaproteobacteria bacterium]|nr:polyprenyl diphosphate synthase [Betaproteobacteria bacterium]MDH4324129.1 polyprenyl diphosphate synthase [Betaproteobacteria bacterium]MDH5210177.1 polyprenyl diphosphate synthase [Betaproteobacteria bacterium]MDH5577163.1 polyprenyl diphosphate synthase [Betaproteobacteria bacterium]
MTSKSSTVAIPAHDDVPRHVAVIMDGNGRWARQRHLPRIAGHKRGVEAVRATVQACAERGVQYLTLFAFSSENWRRPADEVALLMQLFYIALTSEVEKLHRNGIRLRVVGDLSRFDARMRTLIEQGERTTAANARLTLTVAANYGGRWDILQALSRLLREHPEAARGPIEEAQLAPYLAMSYAPEPDLFVRTGGEQRVSNFLLWQLAYTELYFTQTLWPDFDAAALDAAIASYARRERRFGRTSEQLEEAKRAQSTATGALA